MKNKAIKLAAKVFVWLLEFILVIYLLPEDENEQWVYIGVLGAIALFLVLIMFTNLFDFIPDMFKKN